jgi:hypothetical protein
VSNIAIPIARIPRIVWKLVPNTIPLFGKAKFFGILKTLRDFVVYDDGTIVLD